MATEEQSRQIADAVAYDGDECLPWNGPVDRAGTPMVYVLRSYSYGKAPSPNTREKYRKLQKRFYNARTVVLCDSGSERPYKGAYPAVTCGNALCLCKRHLVWRRSVRRERKLSDEQCAAIVASTERGEVLAVRYDVSLQTIRRVRQGKY